MKKRLLSILLCICMVMTLLPTMALATDEPANALTEAIAITADTADAKWGGDTISWDKATMTLTLNGANLTVTDGKYALSLPDGATIELAEDSVNDISLSQSRNIHANTIVCAGNLTIKGAGSLNLSGTGTPGIFAIMTEGALSVNNTSITANATATVFYSRGNIAVSNAKLDLTGLQGLFSEGSMTITNGSEVFADCTSSHITADNGTTIDGDSTIYGNENLNVGKATKKNCVLITLPDGETTATVRPYGMATLKARPEGRTMLTITMVQNNTVLTLDRSITLTGEDTIDFAHRNTGVVIGNADKAKLSNTGANCRVLNYDQSLLLTQHVTDVTRTSATLNGIFVAGNGVEETQRGFQYAPGKQLNDASAPEDVMKVDISSGETAYSLSGLEESTLYSYRACLFGDNGAVLSYGDWVSFITGGSLPRGTGTQEAPYLIGSEDELRSFSTLVGNGSTFAGEYVALDADITMSNQRFTPIGGNNRQLDQNFYFEGTLDGRNHTIANLHINTEDAALFNEIAGNASIRNLTLSGAEIIGGEEAGGFASYIEIDCTLENLTVTGSTIHGEDEAGGIVGYADGEIVFNNCVVTDCTITSSDDQAGGIAGYSGEPAEFNRCVVSGSTITSTGSDYDYEAGGIVGASYNQADFNNCVVSCSTITSSYEKAGGIAGYLNDVTTVTDCKVISSIVRATGENGYVGGIVGYADDSDIQITRCYVSGLVSGGQDADVGGILGYSSMAINISNCQFEGTVTAGGSVGGIAGEIENSDTDTATITNCMAGGTVNGYAAGGILGFGEGTTITGCVALQSQVTGSEDAYRISSLDTGSKNYALKTMKVNDAEVSATDPTKANGADLSVVDCNAAFWSGLGYETDNGWTLPATGFAYRVAPQPATIVVTGDVTVLRNGEAMAKADRYTVSVGDIITFTAKEGYRVAAVTASGAAVFAKSVVVPAGTTNITVTTEPLKESIWVDDGYYVLSTAADAEEFLQEFPERLNDYNATHLEESKPLGGNYADKGMDLRIMMDGDSSDIYLGDLNLGDGSIVLYGDCTAYFYGGKLRAGAVYPADEKNEPELYFYGVEAELNSVHVNEGVYFYYWDKDNDNIFDEGEIPGKYTINGDIVTNGYTADNGDVRVENSTLLVYGDLLSRGGDADFVLENSTVTVYGDIEGGYRITVDNTNLTVYGNATVTGDEDGDGKWDDDGHLSVYNDSKVTITGDVTVHTADGAQNNQIDGSMVSVGGNLTIKNESSTSCTEPNHFEVIDGADLSVGGNLVSNDSIAVTNSMARMSGPTTVVVQGDLIADGDITITNAYLNANNLTSRGSVKLNEVTKARITGKVTAKTLTMSDNSWLFDATAVEADGFTRARKVFTGLYPDFWMDITGLNEGDGRFFSSLDGEIIIWTASDAEALSKVAFTTQINGEEIKYNVSGETTGENIAMTTEETKTLVSITANVHDLTTLDTIDFVPVVKNGDEVLTDIEVQEEMDISNPDFDQVTGTLVPGSGDVTYTVKTDKYLGQAFYEFDVIEPTVTVTMDSLSMTQNGTVPKLTFTTSCNVQNETKKAEILAAFNKAYSSIGAIVTDGTAVGKFPIVPLNVGETFKLDETTTVTIKAVPGTLTVTAPDSGDNGDNGNNVGISSYNITAKAGANGTISPSGSVSVAAGESKTFEIKANGGFAISEVLVDGVSVGAVDKYTFEKVAKSHTISATFCKVFDDVKGDDWFKTAVDFVSSRELFKGTSDTSFSPQAEMSREQMWMVLARLSGKTPANMAEARAWAMENKISDGTNSLGDISREQLVTTLWRCAGSPKSTADLSAFADAGSISDYAKEAMAWAVEKGILQGSDGKLMPTGNAKRCEVAAILMRYCEKTAK